MGSSFGADVTLLIGDLGSFIVLIASVGIEWAELMVVVVDELLGPSLQ